jgi:hypothetical protein
MGVTTLSTDDGRALLFSCHPSSGRGVKMEYPSQDSKLPCELARTLYNISSQLPNRLQQAAMQMGLNIANGASEGSSLTLMRFPCVSSSTLEPVQRELSAKVGPDRTRGNLSAVEVLGSSELSRFVNRILTPGQRFARTGIDLGHSASRQLAVNYKDARIGGYETDVKSIRSSFQTIRARWNAPFSRRPSSEVWDAVRGQESRTYPDIEHASSDV